MGKGIMSRRKSLAASRSVAAVTRGKVKQGGKITAMLKLLPVVKPMFQHFPVILKELGYENLIITN
ncbi:MAG: hypothetical protein KKH97_03190 [Proteobacteria bacterium]|nr:hypothetical protein [Pseudomonadota bacterium]